MSKHEKGRLDCLFSGQDMKLVNIKFCRGDRDVISEEEFCAQICAIADQKRAGMQPSAGPTHSGKSKVDVRAIVAKL